MLKSKKIEKVGDFYKKTERKNKVTTRACFAS